MFMYNSTNSIYSQTYFFAIIENAAIDRNARISGGIYDSLKKAEKIETAGSTISTTLIIAGIKPHLIGFAYLKDEIIILLSELNTRHKTMFLYECVAEKNGVSRGCVERAGRYAIEYAYDHEHKKLLGFMHINDSHIHSHFKFVCWTAEIVRKSTEQILH